MEGSALCDGAVCSDDQPPPLACCRRWHVFHPDLPVLIVAEKSGDHDPMGILFQRFPRECWKKRLAFLYSAWRMVDPGCGGQKPILR